MSNNYQEKLKKVIDGNKQSKVIGNKQGLKQMKKNKR